MIQREEIDNLFGLPYLAQTVAAGRDLFKETGAPYLCNDQLFGASEEAQNAWQSVNRHALEVCIQKYQMAFQFSATSIVGAIRASLYVLPKGKAAQNQKSWDVAAYAEAQTTQDATNIAINAAANYTAAWLNQVGEYALALRPVDGRYIVQVLAPNWRNQPAEQFAISKEEIRNLIMRKPPNDLKH